MSMKQITKIGNTFDYILNILVVFAGILVAFAWVTACFEVVMRYFLNRPTSWVLEINEYAIGWVTFLGAAWLLREEGHVKIDFVVERLNQRAQFLLNFITSCLCVAIWGVLTWYAWEVFWRFYQQGVLTSTALELLRAPIIAIMPIGCFLITIQFLRRSYGYLGKWKRLQTEKTKAATVIKTIAE